jgi:hypothetical protein
VTVSTRVKRKGWGNHMLFVLIVAIPFLYGAFRQFAKGNTAAGAVWLLIGLGLTWVTFQFMLCVGPHPSRYC